MPDPTPEVTPTPEAIELETLRRVKGELEVKHQKQKQRLSEMETELATHKEKAQIAETALREAVVEVPLKRLAESISTVPNTWLTTLKSEFDIQSKNGELVLMTKAGEPVKDAEGKPVSMEERALAKYLTETDLDSERTKLFRLMTRGSKASGAQSASQSTIQPVQDKPLHTFGLR